MKSQNQNSFSQFVAVRFGSVAAVPVAFTDYNIATGAPLALESVPMPAQNPDGTRAMHRYSVAQNWD